MSFRRPKRAQYNAREWGVCVCTEKVGPHLKVFPVEMFRLFRSIILSVKAGRYPLNLSIFRLSI